MSITDQVAQVLVDLDPSVDFDDFTDTETAGPSDTTEEGAERSSFDRIDLGPVLAGNHTQPTPDLLTRDDGRAIWYRGQINGIHGDSGTGKGWVVALAAVECITNGEKVLMIDLEDSPESIIARLRLLGLTDPQIEHGLDYRRPQEPFSAAAVGRLCTDITNGGHALVIIDSLGEAFALNGINEDRDNEVGPWLRRVARPLADTGAGVILVDHSTKAGDRTLHPSGSKRKRAAIGGASYLIEAVRPLKKGTGGRLRLTCAKDRHGNFARGEVVANIAMVCTEGGATSVKVYAPDPPTEDGGGGGGDATVLALALQVVRIVKDSPVPLSKTGVREHIKAKASTDRKRAAVEYAISSGAVAVEGGPRGAHHLVFVHPLEGPTDAP